MTEDTAPTSIGNCSKCGSASLNALPPNNFSRKPGYICTSCGVKHRGPRSTVVYSLILLVGLAFVGVAIMTFVADNRPEEVVHTSPFRPLILGGLVAGWAAWQLRLPKVAAQPKG